MTTEITTDTKNTKPLGAQLADPTATAERVLRLVRAQASDAEAEVMVRTGVEALTRFANSFIHQNVAETVNHVAVKVALDGHVASAALDGPADDDRLARLVSGVIEAARVRPVDADWPGLAPIEAAPDVDHWDDETAEATPGERGQRVREFVDAAGGLSTAGYCATNALTVAFVNSAGQHLLGRTTVATIDGIARTPTSDGSARSSSKRLSDLNGAEIGAAAARKARDGADPTDLDPGAYEVVLDTGCSADILLFLCVYGLNGRAVEEGRSFVRFGEAQFDHSITIRDDTTDRAMVGVPFDPEGTPRRPITLVRDGVTTAVLHTRRTAAKAGTKSTGHAEEGAESWGAVPSNPLFVPGDASLEELVGRVARGVFVTDFHYTRILDPRTEVVTGLTRNGVWLIEDGRISRPIRNLRFTQSYVEALAPGAVRGIGLERTLLADDWGSVALAPALHLASWNFTGGARG